MDIFEAIVRRRSVRAFRPDPVAEELLEQLLDAARWAPSAGNLQAWEIVLVTDPALKRHLRDAALDQRFVEDAPIDIVVCTVPGRSAQRYGDRGAELYCVQDAAAAVQNLLLTAHALGLGACWVGAFHERPVSRALRLPRGVRPVAIVPVGYPAERPTTTPRRPLHTLVHTNRYTA
jgi:nitroreductase